MSQQHLLAPVVPLILQFASGLCHFPKIKNHLINIIIFCELRFYIVIYLHLIMATSNSSYETTKNILRGKATLNPHFQTLANWLKETWGVLPINISYTLGRQEPELEIYFAHRHEVALFYNPDGYTFNSDIRQAISEKMQQLIREQNLAKKYVTENIHIFCRALDKPLQAEADEKIPSAAIQQLKEQLGKEGLWEISRVYSSTTFFVYTQQQIKELADNGTLKRWTDAYFELLKPYDEFNFLQREYFSVLVDSKENFINNYSGNWYYYYK